MDNKLNITVRLSNSEKGPVAFASVTVNDIYTVDGIKIWDNKAEGLNIQMPGTSNTGKTGKKYYNAHFRFQSKVTAEGINKEIEAAYHTTLQATTVEAPLV